jgi:peroxiredoxin
MREMIRSSVLRHLTAIALAVFIFFPAMAQAQQLLQPFNGSGALPEIALSNLDDEPVTLAQYRGKVVIVNFWATWCPPCRKEMPSMQRAWQELQENDVMMLAVHVGGNADQVWQFVSEYDLDFPILIDDTSRVSRSWPMRGLPTTFVIAPDGKIAYMAIGGREWDDPGILEMIYALKE